MKPETIKVIEAISADVLKLVQIVLDDDKVGTNPKTGKNTLRRGALAKDVKANVRQAGDSVVIDVLFGNYLDYIEQGRAPRSGKQPPIDQLRDWALARNIPTDNSTLFLISRAIWRDGYEGRPVLATVEEELEKAFDERWADLIFDAVTEGLEIS